MSAEVNFDAPVNPAKPAKKKAPRKKAAKKRTPAAPRKAAGAEPFPGMTRQRCADDCGEKGCVIGVGYCAHPCKGGLQASDQGNRAAMNRLQTARDQLAVKVDPQRFT
jgi:hypothetical protein